MNRFAASPSPSCRPRAGGLNLANLYSREVAEILRSCEDEAESDVGKELEGIGRYLATILDLTMIYGEPPYPMSHIGLQTSGRNKEKGLESCLFAGDLDERERCFFVSVAVYVCPRHFVPILRYPSSRPGYCR